MRVAYICFLGRLIQRWLKRFKRGGGSNEELCSYSPCPTKISVPRATSYPRSAFIPIGLLTSRVSHDLGHFQQRIKRFKLNSDDYPSCTLLSCCLPAWHTRLLSSVCSCLFRGDHQSPRRIMHQSKGSSRGRPSGIIPLGPSGREGNRKR